MEEGGLLLKFEKMHALPDKCAERRLEMAKSNAITLPEVMAAFILLGVGILASCVMFFLELLYSCVRSIISQRSIVQRINPVIGNIQF